MIWFTSDWHISHSNIIRYCNRPFSSIEEMNKAILDNFFSMVRKGDTVYFLGDLSFNRNSIREVNKKIVDAGIRFVFIVGNHEYENIKLIKELFPETYDLLSTRLQVRGKVVEVTMCHYAMKVWHKSHFNSWNLYAHSHGSLKPEGKQWDVGVDNNSFFPISINDIEKVMQLRPDNFNLVKER